jgi:hypothetical protein
MRRRITFDLSIENQLGYGGWLAVLQRGGCRFCARETYCEMMDRRGSLAE